MGKCERPACKEPERYMGYCTVTCRKWHVDEMNATIERLTRAHDAAEEDARDARMEARRLTRENASLRESLSAENERLIMAERLDARQEILDSAWHTANERAEKAEVALDNLRKAAFIDNQCDWLGDEGLCVRPRGHGGLHYGPITVEARGKELERERDEARAALKNLTFLESEVVRTHRARVAELEALVGNPDTYKSVLMLAQEQQVRIANLERGIEAYRAEWNCRLPQGGRECSMGCDSCAWEREQREERRSPVDLFLQIVESEQREEPPCP